LTNKIKIMRYQPLFGRVIVKDLPSENKTESGIILANTSPFTKAIVLAVSPDARVTITVADKELGVEERLLEVGDVVNYEGSNFPVTSGKEEYSLIRVEQIAFVCIPCSQK